MDNQQKDDKYSIKRNLLENISETKQITQTTMIALTP